MKIAMLGAGAFGTALGGILADKGYDIDYYDSKVEKESLKEVLEKAKLMVLCVPSKAAPHLLPYLPKNKPMIIATKGMLDDRLFRDFKDYMVLSGPGFAVDIKAAKPTKLTATDERVVELLSTDYMSFDMTDDEKGVLMCGALKNVYAILAGLKGLERETADWHEFIAITANEMRLVLEANGAKPETVDLVCGIGDLKLTCGYPSRNYEYGDRRRQNPKYQAEKTVEGLSALARIRHGEIEVPEGAIYLHQLMEESATWD